MRTSNGWRLSGGPNIMEAHQRTSMSGGVDEVNIDQSRLTYMPQRYEFLSSDPKRSAGRYRHPMVAESSLLMDLT